MKMILIIIALVIVAIVGVVVFNGSGGEVDREKMVADYLKENISALSPEKEVLGGKFYITSVVFTGGDSFVVEYEDGHIALKAEGKYKIGKTVEISNFKIYH